MRLVLGDDAAVAAWVAARIPQMSGSHDFGPCAAIGVVSDAGAPLGGVVFHNYQPRFRNIEVSFAADTPRWLSRRLIRGLLSYPFDQLKCQRITTLTPKRNKPAREFLNRFGFKREGVIRRGFGDDDMIISGLLAREWKGSRWMTEPPISKNLRASPSAVSSAQEAPLTPP
jgi:RimJ/RimL family protein N-acetyltransferase